jgi:hypothetical protein
MAIRKISRTSPDPVLLKPVSFQSQGSLAKISHINWLIDKINSLPSHRITTFITLTDAATIAWDYSLSSNAQVTLGGNRALAVPTNVANGDYGTLKIIQDAGGGNTLTLPAAWKIPGGTFTNTTTALAVDIISWVYDGTDFWVTHGANFS